MKLYLQILIIGILVFSSNCQFTCSISGSGPNDGYYNAPTGSGGICTNTGVCKSQFSDIPHSRASRPTLTGDCFHCTRPNYFLDREESVLWGRCSSSCFNGFTDSSNGYPPSSPLQGYCQYCLNPLKKIRGTCGCETEGEYLIDITSGQCGPKCKPGYVQFKQGRQIRFQYTHCIYCYGALVNNSGICECPTNTQFLTDVKSYKCGTKCKPTFTDNLDGSAPNTPTTGHCLTCLSTHTSYGNKCFLTCPSGQYYIKNNGACGTTCAPGYAVSPRRTFPQSPIKDHCKYCQKGLGTGGTRPFCSCLRRNQYLTSTISARCGRKCVSGYTDKSNGGSPNYFTTGNCLFCLAETHEMFLGQCYQYCESGYYHSLNGICSQSCTFGYTDKEDGSTASSPITGHCQYCIQGLVLKYNYVCECEESNEYLTSSNSGTCGATCQNRFTDQSNGGTPSSPLSGHCLYQRLCHQGQFLRQIDGNCGIGTCVPGYTDQSDRSSGSARIDSDCKYCLRGLEKNNGVCECQISSEFLTDISSGICGQTCQYGYTHFSFGTTPTNPSIGHCLYCLSSHTEINGECV